MANFLGVGYTLMTGNQEPETLQWFAVKYEDQPVYAIFDTFAAESGRKAHIDGKVADALRANASTLLAQSPDIAGGHIEILASKVKPTGAESDVKRGVTKGLRVLLKAKASKIDVVREFLKVCVMGPWMTPAVVDGVYTERSSSRRGRGRDAAVVRHRVSWHERLRHYRLLPRYQRAGIASERRGGQGSILEGRRAAGGTARRREDRGLGCYCAMREEIAA